jgi:hypothetical protein
MIKDKRLCCKMFAHLLALLNSNIKIVYYSVNEIWAEQGAEQGFERIKLP